jgi:hypothetical protein
MNIKPDASRNRNNHYHAKPLSPQRFFPRLLFFASFAPWREKKLSDIGLIGFHQKEKGAIRQ